MLSEYSQKLFGREFREKQLKALFTEAKSIKKSIEEKAWKKAVRLLARQLETRYQLVTQEPKLGVIIVQLSSDYGDVTFSGKGSAKCNYDAGDKWDYEYGKRIAYGRARQAIAAQIIAKDLSLIERLDNSEPCAIIHGQVVSPHIFTIFEVMSEASQLSEQALERLARDVADHIQKLAQGEENVPFTDKLDSEGLKVHTFPLHGPVTH